MIASMTAFARTERSHELGEFGWEVRSVNHRYLDVSVRLPEALRGIESSVRECVQRHLRRGKVDCTLHYAPVHGSAVPELDDAVLDALLANARRVIERSTLEARVVIEPVELLRWPGVLKTTGPAQDQLEAVALELLEPALGELQQVRLREGARLAELVTERVTTLRSHARAVRERVPQIREAQRQRLLGRLEDLGVKADAERLEQELAMIAQKGDIAEEIDRLDLHLEEVERVLGRDEAVGRRLDFLMQELNREANTIASKSSDVGLTQTSVDLKVLIEQIREQIQNIE